MSSLTANGTESPQTPGTPTGASEQDDMNGPHDEDFFVPHGSLYMPETGQFRPDKQKTLPDGGTLYIGTYITERAMHRTGIYTPEGYDPKSRTPIVAKTTPLGTSAKGHNQRVAEHIVSTGSVVVAKGPPRYYGPTLTALTLAEDANEMHGLLNAAEHQGIIGNAEEVYVYGESQAAMKALGFMAISKFYNRQVMDGQVVAACFIDKANLRNPAKLIRYGTSMVKGTLKVAKDMSLSDAMDLWGTLSFKDMHHHAIVLPVLLSGETGTFIPHIEDEQRASVQFFGGDKSSRPHRTSERMQSSFPNMSVTLNEEYGHVDGIMSQETKDLRHQIFSRAVEERGAPKLRIVS